MCGCVSCRGCRGNLEGNESHERNQTALQKSFFNCRFVPDLETQLPFLPLCSRNDETTGSLLQQYPQRPSMAIIENFQRADYFVVAHFVQLFE